LLDLQLKLILENKWNNILILLLLVSPIIFAAQANVNNQRFYRVNSPDDYRYIQTDVRYTHNMVLSTSSRALEGNSNNLNDGDVICPGTVTITDTISGSQWARNSGFSANRIAVPGGYDLENSCIPIPNQAGVTPNLPISWNRDNYNSLQGEIFCWSDEGCWGREGPLTNQPVEYDTVNAGSLDGKRGGVDLVCKGQDDVIVRRGGSTISNPAPRDTTGSTSFSYTVALGAHATPYRFESEFNINGCAAVIRYPACNGYDVETVFSRTSAQAGNGAPEYFFDAIPSNVVNIHVENRKSSLEVLSTEPPTNSQLQLPPLGSTTINITVRNNGDVTNKVTGVSATNGFSAIPCPGGGSNGFNSNIGVNDQKILCVLLTAPAYSGDTSTQLSLTYRAQATTCTTNQPDIRNFNMTFSVGQPQPTCFITPPNQNLNQNDTFRFDLSCRDPNNNPILCTNVAWSLAGISANFIEQVNDHATLFITSNSGAGTLRASVNGSVFCNAGITVGNGTGGPPGGNVSIPPNGNQTGPPGSNGCELSPIYSYVHPDEITSFNIRCPNNVDKKCNNVIWAINANTGSIQIADDFFALIKASRNEGQGLINARTDGDTNTCSAQITVSSAICPDFI